jgi:hypothetical protein
MPQHNIMVSDVWNRKMCMTLLAAAATLCMSLVQVKKPTPELVRSDFSEYISLSLHYLIQGRVNISALSVIRSDIMGDASKGWRPNQGYVTAVMLINLKGGS